MNYSHRCKIATVKNVPGYLGEDTIVSDTSTKPCAKSDLSSSEQIDLFGKYTKSAFKLHFQGNIKQIDEIEFEGVKRNIFDVRYHRNSTVVIIS